MIKEILMPKLGETMEEGILNKWLKKEGEKVAKGEPLFEVVTDKATFESEALAEGYLRKIVVQADSEKNVPVLVEWDEDIPEYNLLEAEALKAKKIWEGYHA